MSTGTTRLDLKDYRKNTVTRRKIGLHNDEKMGEFWEDSKGSFPHSPQVYPQRKAVKTPVNTGFAGVARGVVRNFGLPVEKNIG